ncbi:MAG TPA: hypothetical protein VK475_03950 [Pyrinomonadaceae bacterium]|nr:hypothetical protein [Pyrinomonadaceae bacterium]
MSVRKKLFTLSVVTMFVLGGALPMPGQRRTAKLDLEFNAFWIKFRAAVARSDKPAVADMTKLPFILNGKDLDRVGFIKQYTSLFTPKMRRCFARARPSRDQDSMEIFCGQQIFLFAKVDGVYKFTEIGAND